jgi:hypothetical protein
MKQLLHIFVKHGDRDEACIEYLLKNNYVELPSAYGSIFVALQKGKKLLCLPCLLLEKMEVEFRTKTELLNHIDGVHSHLMSQCDVYA